MSAIVSNSLKSLSAFLQDHQVSFSNGLLILFTIGGEQIFRFNAFKCPCTHDEAFIYALIFMLVPAFVLGIIGVAVSNLTWRIFHGCRKRSKTALNGWWKTLQYAIIVIARASVVPFAWLFIALLDGNYFACMMATEPCGKVLNTTTTIDFKEINHLKAVSQNYAWISLGVLILVSFIVICFVRCCDSVTFIQYKYLNSYREAEQEVMDKAIEECTKEKAVSNVNQFKISLHNKQLDKEDWDNISRAPDHSLLQPKQKNKDEGDNLNKKSAYAPTLLTPLDKWVSKLSPNELESGTNSQPQQEEQNMSQGAEHFSIAITGV